MRLAFLSLLLPAAALAQTGTIKVTSDLSTVDQPQIYIGRDACSTRLINFSWDLGTGRPFATEQVVLLGTQATTTCSATTVTKPDVQFDGAPQTKTGTKQLAASALILDTSDAGLYGGCSNTDRTSATPYTAHFCVQLRPVSTIGGGTPDYGQVAVNFATALPTPPSQPGVAPGDSHLRLTWTAGNSAENISTYDVHVAPHGQGFEPAKYALRVTAQTTADVSTTDDGTALENGKLYDVAISATDVYGNVSTLGPSLESQSPQAVADFYNHYRDAGGVATGGHGCSSAGGLGWMALLALATALLARRRKALPAVAKTARGAKAAALAVLGVLALAVPAQAAQLDRPERKLLVGVKADRYDPKVDSQPGLTGTPYADIFGTRKPVRVQLEVDWEAAHPFGSLLLGVTVGYWQNIGKGRLVDGTPSQDTALLDVIPFGLVATYRFDWLTDRYRWFPLVPYAQAGLQCALWAAFNGTGSVAKRSDGRGSGWTYGYTTALGVAFALDALDPDLSREAFVSSSIQRTSIFAEYGWTRLDNFRKGNALILTDRGWRFGLALEF